MCWTDCCSGPAVTTAIVDFNLPPASASTTSPPQKGDARVVNRAEDHEEQKEQKQPPKEQRKELKEAEVKPQLQLEEKEPQARWQPPQSSNCDGIRGSEDVLPAVMTPNPRRLQSANTRSSEQSGTASAPTGSTFVKSLTTAFTPKEKRRYASGNLNVPQDYRWLEGTLEALARNEGSSLGCKDLSTGMQFWPLFFLVGSCPNMWCGMQVVMYSASPDGNVDFWWVKPKKDDGSEIEIDTLNRHGKGPHKNDPGRSKQFLKPLADFFVNKERLADGTVFGIERVGSGDDKCMRAYLERPSDGGQPCKLYLDVVWQEDWSSNPFARSYIKGKLVYQKEPDSEQFFARQYSITNNKLTLYEKEEPCPEGVLPGDFIKDLLA